MNQNDQGKQQQQKPTVKQTTTKTTAKKQQQKTTVKQTTINPPATPSLNTEMDLLRSSTEMSVCPHSPRVRLCAST